MRGKGNANQRDKLRARLNVNQNQIQFHFQHRFIRVSYNARAHCFPRDRNLSTNIVIHDIPTISIINYHRI